jgi:hypothetical protein
MRTGPRLGRGTLTTRATAARLRSLATLLLACMSRGASWARSARRLALDGRRFLAHFPLRLPR